MAEYLIHKTIYRIEEQLHIKLKITQFKVIFFFVKIYKTSKCVL